MDNRKRSLVDTILTTIVGLLAFAMVWGLLSDDAHVLVPAVSIAILAAIVFALVRYTISSDHMRAQQANETLALANQTLTYMRQGLSSESAQEVCQLLVPAVDALAVGMSSTSEVIGYSGVDADQHAIGNPIPVPPAELLGDDGEAHVLHTPTSIGLADLTVPHSVNTTLIAPLVVRDEVVGTLMFYYRSESDIDENQEAMVAGLAQLLSTQLSLAELDAQTELATRMELKALQAQINPHFLFNTINTMASLCRTDPDRARTLLREFAIFYRRVLENSQDLIPLTAEIEQTQRYLTFEKARFGDERLAMDVQLAPDIGDLNVPSFVVQPIVENSVGHAMRDEGTLHITITGTWQGDDAVIAVADDGVGMPPDKVPLALKPGYGSGIGIALKNVDDRLKGYFGANSGVRIESQLGVGTTVYLTFARARS